MKKPGLWRWLVIGLLAMGVLIAAVLTRSQGNGETEAGPLDQVRAVVAGQPAGTLPVEDLSSSEFLRTLGQAPQVAVPVIDPIGGRTAAVFGDRILSTVLLPQQVATVAETYEALGLDVVVAPVPVQAAAPQASGNLTAIALLLLLLAAGLMVVIARRRGQTNSNSIGTFIGTATRRFGRFKRPDSAEVPEARFADVAGCDEAIEDMRELVAFIKHPERFTRIGAVPPRGALLVGPPGTGKTLLARAVAGEAGVPFYSAAGSDFVEMYVGVGAKRVRDLFAKARKHPEGAILFIDEIDAVGRKRSSGPSSNGEQENTLNALLVEMDGFLKSRVIVIAASNRDDILDSALTRPGRLDRKITVGLPDRAGRERILSVHVGGKPLASGVDLNLIARRTPGMSGADLAQLVNEACLVAAREDRGHVNDGDFDSAIATVTMGKARTSAVISEEDRILTAWHEAGHAVCGLAQPEAVSPVSISIVPRGNAGGVTHFPARDSSYLTRRQAYAQLVTAMGGMAAEQRLLGDGEFTSGPSGDLQQGSNLAFAMVTQLGMGERLLVKTEAILGAGGGATDEAVAEADALLRQALEDSHRLLAQNDALVRNMVDALLEWETLTNAQIDELMAGRAVVDAGSPPPSPRQPAIPGARVPSGRVRVRAESTHRVVTVAAASRRGRPGTPS
jgi:cell division protease FtsH